MANYPTDHRAPWIDDNGFLRVRTGIGRRTRAAVEKDLAIAVSFAANGTLKSLWDGRAAVDMDSEAWIPLIRQLESIASALAVLTSDITTPLATLFQKRVNSVGIPCQAFSDEESAIAWLKAIEA